MLPQTITTLVVSGGSFKCTAFVGCFKYLEEKGILKSIKRYIGTSAGAALCFFLCMGMTPSGIEDTIKKFFKMQKDYQPDIDTMLNLFYTLGMDKGTLVVEFFKSVLKSELGVDDISFIDFAKRTGTDLVICACRLKDMKDTYFSVDTSPDMSVITALRASVSIPFIFMPVNINNTLYIDAGLIVNFPIAYVRECRLKDALGVAIADNPNSQKKDTDMNLLDMLQTMLQSSIRIMNKASATLSHDNVHTIMIDTGDSSCLDFCYDMNTMEFNVPDESLKNYIQIGYDRTKEYFGSLVNSKP
jgi:NTE family protein